ncbi:hypothetical protein SNOG_14190 [Parastagonospora nodorum SN15]|uniref:Uncharacterized protein n=1 Tax=Phaeosphaeria nodorum (strain SN15 / ATCC MYA-4574 / FGSC 10173) TaxID=321614 RepID=Q0U216_PHANO|nr:hypothetical protein SNOG_14190 [Parastagonospora nodorum SN15]EAT78427.1 hypothetical protein SNOG_14190 [Parastagonospora nodorum SN15]
MSTGQSHVCTLVGLCDDDTSPTHTTRSMSLEPPAIHLQKHTHNPRNDLDEYNPHLQHNLHIVYLSFPNQDAPISGITPFRAALPGPLTTCVSQHPVR